MFQETLAFLFNCISYFDFSIFILVPLTSLWIIFRIIAADFNTKLIKKYCDNAVFPCQTQNYMLLVKCRMVALFQLALN